MKTAILAAALLYSAATFAGPVEVRFEKPESFTDVKMSYYPNARERDGILGLLKTHLEQQAVRHIPPGSSLTVVVTDVDLAGDFEMPAGRPGLWSVRIVKDLYPPRMSLSFRLVDAQGAVLREGSRKLSDMSFMMGDSTSRTDLLRYEKRMLDDWLQREFAPPKSAAANANR